jgi:hypothetical protein
MVAAAAVGIRVKKTFSAAEVEAAAVVGAVALKEKVGAVAVVVLVISIAEVAEEAVEEATSTLAVAVVVVMMAAIAGTVVTSGELQEVALEATVAAMVMFIGE